MMMDIAKVNRNNAIDLMKCVLVLQMIGAHIVQFFPVGRLASLFSTYVNLTTFSGFMFVFGYVCELSYASKEADTALMCRLGKRMLKTLLAFYISGIAYTLFVDNGLSLQTLGNIIILNTIPGYSEFLLSFAFLYPLLFVWTWLRKRMKTAFFFIPVIISLLLTKIDYGAIRIPLVGVLIGTNTFSCFPIFQYISYFLAGSYLSASGKKFDTKLFIIAVAGTGYGLGLCIINHTAPERFPPQIGWIVGGYAFVYGYYLLCNGVSKRYHCHRFLLAVGKNSLTFLVVSNIVIFVMSKCVFFMAFPVPIRLLFCAMMYIMCILASSFWIIFRKHLKRYCGSGTV